MKPQELIKGQISPQGSQSPPKLDEAKKLVESMFSAGIFGGQAEKPRSKHRRHASVDSHTNEIRNAPTSSQKRSMSMPRTPSTFNDESDRTGETINDDGSFTFNFPYPDGKPAVEADVIVEETFSMTDSPSTRVFSSSEHEEGAQSVRNLDSGEPDEAARLKGMLAGLGLSPLATTDDGNGNYSTDQEMIRSLSPHTLGSNESRGRRQSDPEISDSTLEHVYAVMSGESVIWNERLCGLGAAKDTKPTRGRLGVVGRGERSLSPDRLAPWHESTSNETRTSGILHTRSCENPVVKRTSSEPRDTEHSRAVSPPSGGSPQKPRSASSQPASMLTSVEDTFRAYCGQNQTMDNRSFEKLCRQCALIKNDRQSNFTSVQADLIFWQTVPKGQRRMELAHFLEALEEIAERRGIPVETVRQLVSRSSGPVFNTTMATGTADQTNSHPILGFRTPLLERVPSAENFSEPLNVWALRGGQAVSSSSSKTPDAANGSAKTPEGPSRSVSSPGQALSTSPIMRHETTRRSSPADFAQTESSRRVSPHGPQRIESYGQGSPSEGLKAGRSTPSIAAHAESYSQGSPMEATRSEGARRLSPPGVQRVGSQGQLRRISSKEQVDHVATPLSPFDMPQVQNDEIGRIFAMYCDRGQSKMDSFKFAKMCKDCNLYDRNFSGPGSADIIFTQVLRDTREPGRKIDLWGFEDALRLVAEKKSVDPEEVFRAVADSDGPNPTRVTKADFVRYHDDTRLYTGTHAHGGPDAGRKADGMKDGTGKVSRDIETLGLRQR